MLISKANLPCYTPNIAGKEPVRAPIGTLTFNHNNTPDKVTFTGRITLTEGTPKENDKANREVINAYSRKNLEKLVKMICNSFFLPPKENPLHVWRGIGLPPRHQLEGPSKLAQAAAIEIMEDPQTSANDLSTAFDIFRENYYGDSNLSKKFVDVLEGETKNPEHKLDLEELDEETYQAAFKKLQPLAEKIELDFKRHYEGQTMS